MMMMMMMMMMVMMVVHDNRRNGLCAIKRVVIRMMMTKWTINQKI